MTTMTMTVAPERPDLAPDGFPSIDPPSPQPDGPPGEPFPPRQPQPEPDPLPDRPPMPEPPTDPFPSI